MNANNNVANFGKVRDLSIIAAELESTLRQHIHPRAEFSITADNLRTEAGIRVTIDGIPAYYVSVRSAGSWADDQWIRIELTVTTSNIVGKLNGVPTMITFGSYDNADSIHVETVEQDDTADLEPVDLQMDFDPLGKFTLVDAYEEHDAWQNPCMILGWEGDGVYHYEEN